MEEQWKLLDHCLNCEDIISTPILFYAPHCSRQEKVLHCTRKPQDTNTSKSHHKGHYHGEHSNETTHEGVRCRGSAHTPGTKQKHSETQIDAYSIPHPVPPKITPGPEWCRPQHLLACLWPCSLCGGKTEIFLTKEINYTLISLTYT